MKTIETEPLSVGISACGQMAAIVRQQSRSNLAHSSVYVSLP